MTAGHSPDRAKLLQDAMTASKDAHYALMFANFGLKGMSYGDPDYVDRLDALDGCALILAHAKWLYWRSTGEAADFAEHTRSDSDLVEAIELFAEASQFANQIRDASDEALASLSAQGRELKTKVSSDGHEVLKYQNVPIVPSICPIVVLKGNSIDMGRQYVNQIVEIYGEFPFASLAKRTFTSEQSGQIRKWEAELATHAPEILDMAKGMSEGAIRLGIQLSYDQALYMWTGDSPPAESPVMIGVLDAEVCSITGYFGGGGEEDQADIEDAPDLCSGFAVWGEGVNADGAVAACTTDHDCTFQATIVAYPDTGRPFVFTPFSVNGSIPGVGRFFMTGHPGVNDRGVAYVHHGGPCGCTEPQENWGYGVKRGPSVFHNLRFAESAQAAQTYEMHLPISDNGYLMGSPGGFYADPNSAYVLESRTGGPKSEGAIIRERSYDDQGRAYEFLYANNNIQSVEAEGLFCPPEGGYDFDVVTGWRSFDREKNFSGDLGQITRHLWAISSEPRNRYLHSVLKNGYGQIDADYAAAVYRRSARLDTNHWQDVEDRINSGEQLDGSTATRMNAFTSVMELKRDSAPIYRAAIGPIAHRSAPPHRAGYGFYYYDETNTMWELTLEASPGTTLDTADALARELVQQADELFATLSPTFPGRARLDELRIEAHEALKKISIPRDSGASDEHCAEIAKCLRLATRAQVRSLQVIEAIRPPADDPEALLA